MDHKLANPSFWQNEVAAGMFITIKDEKEILESGKMEGLDYKIRYVRTFRDSDGLAEWNLLYLESESSPAWLLVKIVGDDIDFRVYYAEYGPDFFKEGHRVDVLEWEQNWIFQEPEDPEDFNIADLRYTQSIFIDNDGSDIEYKMKDFGEIYGELSEEPSQIITSPTPAIIVEYAATTECDDPELLILEIGEEDDGGFISLLMGNPVGIQELEVIG